MTYHRIKPRLVNGVHYRPLWADPGTFVDPPARKLDSETVEVRKEAKELEGPAIKLGCQTTRAIQNALGTTYARAATISVLIQANGAIVPYEDLGKNINVGGVFIYKIRQLLGREAVINHTGQGYSLCPDVRRYIIERAGLSDV